MNATPHATAQERMEQLTAIAGPGSSRKHPLSYIRDPKRKQKLRQHRAKGRAAAALTRTIADQLKRLERRGHGHCAEAEAIREGLSGAPSRGRSAP